MSKAGIGRWFYADYSTFSLESESSNYVLHLKGFNGGIDSQLNKSIPSTVFVDGMPFSAHDSPNVGSCAKSLGGGWWFNYYCSECCLTCRASSFRMGRLSYIASLGPLRAARMMIKSG